MEREEEHCRETYILQTDTGEMHGGIYVSHMLLTPASLQEKYYNAISKIQS